MMSASRQKYDTFENDETPAVERTDSTPSVRIEGIQTRDLHPMEPYRPSLSCDPRFQLFVGVAQIVCEVISSLIDWVVYGTASSSDSKSSVNAFLAFTIVGMIILALQVVYMVLFYRLWKRDLRLDIMSIISVCFKLLPQVAIIFYIEAVEQTDHYNSSQIVRIVHALVDVAGRIIVFALFIYRQYTRDEKRALQEHNTIMPMFGLHCIFTIIIVTLSIITFANN